MAEIGVTELGQTSVDLAISVVQDTLKEKAKLLPTVTDYSSFITSGGDVAKAYRRDQLSAQDKLENTELTAQELTFFADDIPLDKKKAFYVSLEKFAEIESQVDVVAEIIKEMANEMALEVDRAIINELRLASASAPDHRIQISGGSNDELTDADVLSAQELLDNAKVPESDRYMLISTRQNNILQRVGNYIQQDTFGPNNVIRNGQIGIIRGFRVFKHTELSANEVVFYHKSAVGYANQMKPKFETDFHLPSVSHRMLLAAKFGTKVLDAGVRQVLANATGA